MNITTVANSSYVKEMDIWWFTWEYSQKGPAPKTDDLRDLWDSVIQNVQSMSRELELPRDGQVW